MALFSIKRGSWARRDRPVELGPNIPAVQWVDRVAGELDWSPSVWTTARVVYSWTRSATWRGMRLCIGWLVEKTGYSRTAVKNALKSLKEQRFLLRDGEVHVDQLRAVVKYRAAGTPDFPLPEDVIMAREAEWEAEMSITPEWEETAGQDRSDHTNYRGEVTATQDHVSGRRFSSSITPSGGGLNMYRSAKPIRTGPERTTGGEARRPTHLSQTILRPMAEVRKEARAGRWRALQRDLKRALARGKTQKRYEDVSDAVRDSPWSVPSDWNGV